MSSSDLEPRVSRADRERERELLRYFPLPPQSSPKDALSQCSLESHNAHDGKPRSQNTALTAFAQLTAIRLNAQRAMISVIDRANQHFIAEATKSLSLNDTTVADNTEDGLWVGCATVDKRGRLCEKTIELPPMRNRTPCLTVQDLGKDVRFNTLPFVAGPPYFKFYVGTPLTTKRGINIGSLFILDDHVREPLNRSQEDFLGTMASLVMQHMELTSEAEERKAIERMSLGLSSFIEGKSHIGPLRSSIQDQTQEQTIDRKLAGLKLNTSSDGTDDSDAETAPDHVNIERGHAQTCIRAANLLSEAFGFNDAHAYEGINTGGVIFLDATTRVQRGNKPDIDTSSPSSPTPSLSHLAEVVCASDNASKFTPLSQEQLYDLLKRFPRGKVWSFDTDGALASSEEDPGTTPEIKTGNRSEWNRTERRHIETNMLAAHFPGCKHLIFTGLWDAGQSRWFLGAFVWATSSHRVFSTNPELFFLRSFGNFLMAHVSRLASMASDRQKADFIGSISHEFRSPLHGILASVDFLAETENDPFQSSLVDTISLCGRTLLDTINHILDYSKINSFERSWRNSKSSIARKRATSRQRAAGKQIDAPPMLNIFAQTNIATITEEVVEGVVAGQLYQDVGYSDTTFAISSERESSRRKLLSNAKDIAVILDIRHHDYTFVTQPGALKRVIMNILGNALKYTERGEVIIWIDLKPLRESDEESKDRTLTIKISDTGKGISKAYLRTNLYSPFAQEDVLASGTGLGLSIVKSIVVMLDGTIDVQSELSKGTHVTIEIPLSRTLGDTPVSTPSSIATTRGHEGDAIHLLSNAYGSSKVKLFGFAADQATFTSAIKCYIEDWYSMSLISETETSPSQQPDIIIVDESMLELCLNSHPGIPMIILFDVVKHAQTGDDSASGKLNTRLSKPIGPYKLAKAMLSSLERTQEHDQANPGSTAQYEYTRLAKMQEVALETDHTSEPIRILTDGIVSASLDSTNIALAAVDASNSMLWSESESTSGLTESSITDFPFPQQSGIDSKPSLEENPTKPIKEGPQSPRAQATLGTRNDTHEPSTSIPVETLELPTPVPVETHPNDTNVETSIEQVCASNKRTNNGTSPSRYASSKERTNSGKESVTGTLESSKTKRIPRLLLVEDNQINLRLLQMFMRKRRYETIDSVNNGQLAISAVKAQSQPYDIIFMDISMPIMNGFEATRAIRDLEDRVSREQGGTDKPARSLIIALTGLASSRDQVEAFSSGIDVFMTKPVSFKDVAKLLDSWELRAPLSEYASQRDLSPAAIAHSHTNSD